MPYPWAPFTLGQSGALLELAVQGWGWGLVVGGTVGVSESPEPWVGGAGFR